jgi:hypothetical protein
MLFAYDLKSGKEVTASDVSLLLLKDDLSAFFICPRCNDELRFVKKSANRVEYFAHKSEAKISAPCVYRIIDDRSSSGAKKFDKSFTPMDMNGLVRAISKEALHYLTEFRSFFGASKKAYHHAKENSKQISFNREEFWVGQINQMFILHQTSFNVTNRKVNEYFFKYLIQKQKVRPHSENHIITEFHQILHLAIAAARSLVGNKAKADKENGDLKTLLSKIDNHDFWELSKSDATNCAQIFQHNIGNQDELNFSQLASLLVAERFVEIVMDLDIRGFLMDPEQFMGTKNNNGKILGFVYVLIAPTHAVQGHPLLLKHNNIVKIGETRRIPEKRAEDLSAGLLAESYVVHNAVLTNARLKLEEIVHAELHDRLVAKREFFDISPNEAIKLIRQRKKTAEEIGDDPNDKRNLV